MAFSIKQTKARSTDGRAKIAHTVKIVKSSSLPQVTQTQQHRVIINLTVYVLEALGPQLHSFDCSWRQQIFKRSFTFVLLSVPPPISVAISHNQMIYYAQCYWVFIMLMRSFVCEKYKPKKNYAGKILSLFLLTCSQSAAYRIRSDIFVLVSASTFAAAAALFNKTIAQTTRVRHFVIRSFTFSVRYVSSPNHTLISSHDCSTLQYFSRLFIRKFSRVKESARRCVQANILYA